MNFATENKTLICFAKRTPIGKYLGAYKNTSAPRLGATVVEAALKELQLTGKLFDEIIMGQVLQAGCGQAPARQTAILGGLAESVCATTINRVCASGLKAVMLAHQAIQLGDAKMIFAGGQENMSLSPHLLAHSRKGLGFGQAKLEDHMQIDGLFDPYHKIPMGTCADLCAQEKQISREEQDDFALESYRRSQEACQQGYFNEEIIAVRVKEKKLESIIKQDEEPFAVKLEKLKNLRPAFDPHKGSVTAGNASTLSDGAAGLVLTNSAMAKEHNLPVLAHLKAQASHAQDPKWFTTAPIACIQKLLEKTGLKTKDIDLFEINEAFAVVSLVAIKELGLNPKQVNIHGGAVSLGHPLGASGARVLVTLIHALRRQGLKRGIACLCIGGGEASAVMVEV